MFLLKQKHWSNAGTSLRFSERASSGPLHPEAHIQTKLLAGLMYTSPVDEALLSRSLEDLEPKLQSLHTFKWDGYEMPGDSLWATLRKSCAPFTLIPTITQV